MKTNKTKAILVFISYCFFILGCNQVSTTSVDITTTSMDTTTSIESESTTIETEEEETTTVMTEEEETSTSTSTTVEQTPQEILDEAAASLVVPQEISSGAGFFLFYTDEVVTCAWVSDNEAVIDIDFMGGEAQMYQTMVHRPAYIDVSVTLTATLSYGEETKVVPFTILVRAENRPEDLLMEDLEMLTLDNPIELSTVDLPANGLNGSTISWELDVTDKASLVGNELTLHYNGIPYEITLTATLSFETATDTKTILLEVASRNISSIETLLSTPVGDVFVKGTVYFFYEKGFFLFDETGFLNVYTDSDWSSLIALGDEVLLSGDMVNGIIGWELWFPELETIISSGNSYTQTTQEYIFAVSFPRPLETWVITGRIEVIDSIVYVYSGSVRIAIIEQSTYDDSYNALKEYDGQTVSFRAANYYFYSSCYGFLYQEGAFGITVVG